MFKIFRKNDKEKQIEQSAMTYYFKDKSISTETEDRFQHKHYVDTIKDIILHCETPFNIGLYGRWGVGKSSILSMLETELKKKDTADKFKFLYIDAWGLLKTSLQQEILVNLNNQLRSFSQSQIEDVLYNTREELPPIKEQLDHLRELGFRGSFLYTVRKFWPILSLAVVIFLSYYFFKNETEKFITTIGAATIFTTALQIRHLIGASKRVIPKISSSYQFGKIYESMINKQGKKKMVVVIDNLDRCDDETAVNLLGIIQTFMTKENCINILACDDEAIVNHLKHVMGDTYTERDGNEFLSKFFQVTIRIPPFIGKNLSSYVDELMKERTIPFHASVKRILISGAIKNPRKINQFLNNIVAMYTLADRKERGGRLTIGAITKNTAFLTKIIILRHEWPDFYKAVEKNPLVLDPKNQSYADWIGNFKSMSHIGNYDELQLDGLTDFLMATRSCVVDDVKPFLVLNQEDYQSLEGTEKFELDVNNYNSDSVIETIQKSTENDQEKWIQKICDMNTENAKKGDLPSLENSTKTLIDVLDIITGDFNKDNALDSLGQYISSEQILQRLDEFDMEKLFRCVKNMPLIHQKPIFEKIQPKLTAQDNALDIKILTLFLRNSEAIHSTIISKIDTLVETVYSTNETSLLDVIEQCCSTDLWIVSNIKKPSKIISAYTNSLTFNDDDIENKRLQTLFKIYNTIDKSEQQLVIDRIRSIIEDSKNTKTLPKRITETILNLEIPNFEQKIRLEQLFNTITKSINFIADVEQRKKLFEIAFVISPVENIKNY